ncbi:hypothetical protein Trydic_g8824 [Trypoxylus dichotomus]
MEKKRTCSNWGNAIRDVGWDQWRPSEGARRFLESEAPPAGQTDPGKWQPREKTRAVSARITETATEGETDATDHLEGGRGPPGGPTGPAGLILGRMDYRKEGRCDPGKPVEEGRSLWAKRIESVASSRTPFSTVGCDVGGVKGHLGD